MARQIMQEIYEPRLQIDLGHLRKHPAEWYLTSEGDGLYAIAQKLKGVCNYGWANGICRLHHIAGGNTFKFSILRVRSGDNKYSFGVWDDVRGLVVSRDFRPDDDGLIPEETINEIDKHLARWTKGKTDCRECGKEMCWLESYGMYYDSKYCSEECAALHYKQELQRSR